MSIFKVNPWILILMYGYTIPIRIIIGFLPWKLPKLSQKLIWKNDGANNQRQV